MKHLRRRTLASALVLATVAAFGAEPLGLRDLYRPFRTEHVALSPDGRHLAYTTRESDWLNLAIVDLDQPSAKPRVIPIGEDLLEQRWPIRIVHRAAVITLRWPTPDLLVYGRRVPVSGDVKRRLNIELRAVDPAAKHDRKLVDQYDLSVAIGGPGTVTKVDGVETAGIPPPQLIPRPPRLLGFSPDNPAMALVEAAGGMRDQYITSVFAVDARTGKLTRRFSRDDQANFLHDANGDPRLEQGSRIFTPFVPTVSFNGPPPPPYIRPRAFHYRPAGDGPRTDWDKFAAGFAPPAPTFTHEDETYFQPRALPLAFAADPNVLYFASNLGRDTFGLYALDLASRARTDLAVEIEGLDLALPGEVFSERPLIFDRARRLVGVRLDDPQRSAHWLDQELAGVQQMLDAKFPGRRVEILEWNEARSRFLVLVTGWSDPGRYYLFDKDRVDGLAEIARRAPSLPAAALQRSDSFSFVTAAGVGLSGHITIPRRVRTNPPPLLVVCRDIPGGRPPTGFDRDAQAFAAMGFVVAQVNYRGAAGLGLRHRDAARGAFDRVPIEDLRATIDWLAARYPFNRRRVALFGEGFGGYIALRALQLHPEEFRCAVSFDAPTEPANWLNESRSAMDELIARRRAFFQGDLDRISLTREPTRFTKPVFLLQRESGGGAWAGQGRALRDALKRHDREVDYWEISGELRGEPEERAQIVSRIGAFLNEHVYDYGARIGELKEVK